MDEPMSQTDVEAIIALELPKMPGWCTPEKGRRMAELARGASLCVELGVFGGRGLVSMALTLRDQGFGRADGIDPFSAAAAIEGTNDPANDAWWVGLDYEAIARVAQAAICQLGVFHCARLIRTTSREVVEYYIDESIDVLHQDSNHSEEISCEEVAMWSPKVRIGGFWVFDDTNWTSTRKAQQELTGRGFEELEDYESWKVYLKCS
jgi:predicted O-methyltransferase YrrM